MTAPIKIGDLTVRPHVRSGTPSGKWQLDIPTSLTGGVRKRKLYGSREEAVATAKELRKRLRMQEVGFSAKPVRHSLSIDDAVREWERAEEDRVATLKKQAVSLYTDKCRLKAVLAFFKGRDIAHLDDSSLLAYQKNRLAAAYSPASINSELRSFNKVFGWALRNKFIDTIPKVERIPEAGLEMVVVPTLEEVRRIIDALPAETVPLVWFIALTGCRPGEAYNLTWDCVDEVNGWVEIKPKDDWRPKNANSIRRLPIDGMLLDLIRKQPKDGRFVFPSTVDPTKARTNMRKAFASAVKAAKIMRGGKRVLDITPKSLRKAFASWQANNGLHPRVLQALMGHAPGSAVTDRHYIKADEEAMRTAVARMLPATQQKQG